MSNFRKSEDSPVLQAHRACIRALNPSLSRPLPPSVRLEVIALRDGYEAQILAGVDDVDAVSANFSGVRDDVI